jgi:plasmid stability protein
VFYAYVIREPLSRLPIYIGKGQGRRAHDHSKPGRNSDIGLKIRELRIAGLDPEIQIVPADSEADAFEMEELLISMAGRIDLGTGPLLNRTSGGQGWSHSEATKARISASKTGKPRPDLVGRVVSEETREKLRQAHLGRKFPFKARGPHSEERKAKISAARMGYSMPAEVREKISAAQKGHVHSSETKAKMSASLKGRPKSEETRARISKARLEYFEKLRKQ